MRLRVFGDALLSPALMTEIAAGREKLLIAVEHAAGTFAVVVAAREAARTRARVAAAESWSRTHDRALDRYRLIKRFSR